ncbi:MAG: NAD(+)/NADH kinase [Phycisphaerae bacterium]|nr:NAD(+)/NADH kinase [Phycisphaerae bacterium]
MAQKKPRIVIFGDPQKGEVTEVIDKFIRFAASRADIAANCGIVDCSLDILKQADYAVVFGGDGSIISAARFLSESEVPVIGVNLGKLGFLAEFSIGELQEYFDDIIAKQVYIEKRLMVSCQMTRDGKEVFSSVASNDVFITAGPPYRMIELAIIVDGQPLASCASDGLIISTPTGSTAYNLSAGGPILSTPMDALVITSICPHSLSFRPIVINADSVVEVEGLKVNEGTTVSVDGQITHQMDIADKVTIRKHKGKFLVVNNPKRTKWDTLATKLNWAEKPRYRG